ISVVAVSLKKKVYVAFRFDIGLAPGAVLALLHDVSLTAGVFVLLQREFNLPMIGALLTIVGYSLNDTIVIYDRIRENSDRYRRKELRDLINVSINETLARTLATSVTTLLAISAFLIMGGPVIQTFAFAMMLGIIFGTYSTVFVASPTIMLMERIKPHLSALVAGGAVPAEESSSDAPLTQAERRRRERAAVDKDEPTL
ncbi:MAG: protein translocase subunit SecF, partial [Deltaproteobacteria bacterium]|nr:protein translocase subunit SecF [Deltaproteobacteria bacterium]